MKAHAATMTLAATAVAVMLGSASAAHADTVAYLVNVTVRPGYNFANADQALSYGHRICDKISQGRSYEQVIGDIADDFSTGNDYQASYLITQAVNELCPGLIWQVRNSAAAYRPAAP